MTIVKLNLHPNLVRSWPLSVFDFCQMPMEDNPEHHIMGVTLQALLEALLDEIYRDIIELYLLFCAVLDCLKHRL